MTMRTPSRNIVSQPWGLSIRLRMLWSETSLTLSVTAMFLSLTFPSRKILMSESSRR